MAGEPLAPWLSDERPDYLGRGKYFGELTDPKVRDRLIAYTDAEVGGQGPEAQQAFIETTFNRGVSRNQSLPRVLSGSYFPTETHVRAQRPVTQAMRDRYEPIINDVLFGSNISRYATGNASGTVGFAGGPQTFASKGERFGIEGPDRDWYKKVAAAREGGDSVTDTPMAPWIPEGQLDAFRQSESTSTSAPSPTPTASEPPLAPWMTPTQQQTAAPQAPREEEPEPPIAPWIKPAAEEPAQRGLIAESVLSPLRGAAADIGSRLQGFGALGPETARQEIARLQEEGNLQPPGPDASAAEVAAYRQRIGVLGRRTPEVTAERIAARQEEAQTPAAQTGPYQLGTKVAEALPASTHELNPVVEDFLTGLGSFGASYGTALIPGVGVPLTIASTPFQGAGEAAQRAIQAGATEEQIAQATRQGLAPGASEFADALLPSLGVPGKLAKILGKAGPAILKGAESALIEGGQEGLQQWWQNMIAKGIYNPQQDVWDQVGYNALIGGAVGGVVGGVHGAIEKKPVTEQGTQSEGLPGNPTGTMKPDEIFQIPDITNIRLGGRVLTPGEVVPSVTADGEKLPAAVDPTTATTGGNPTGVFRIDESQVLERRAEGPDVPGGNRPALFPGYVEPPAGASIYYSQLLKVAEAKLPGKGTAAQILSTLENPNNQIKMEEMNDMGLRTYLESLPKGSISKETVLDYIRENSVVIDEIYSSAGPVGPGTTRYSQYIAPGPYLKYEELRIAIPSNPMLGPEGVLKEASGVAKERPGFKGQHWGDEMNVLFHAQLTTRIDKAGDPTLHIDGFQSDQQQLGQKIGFLTDAEAIQIENLKKERESNDNKYEAIKLQRDDAARLSRNIQAQKRKLYEHEKITGQPRDLQSMAVLDQQDDLAQREFDAHVVALQKLRDRNDEINYTIRDIREVPHPDPDLARQGRKAQKPAIARMQTKYVEFAMRRLAKYAADRGYKRLTVSNGDLAILYNTGAMGRSEDVKARIKKGLQYTYDQVLPSRMKDLAKKYNAVVEKQLISMGWKYPKLEIRASANYPGEYEVINARTGNSEGGAFRNEREAQEYVDYFILKQGPGAYEYFDHDNRDTGQREYLIYRANEPLTILKTMKFEANAKTYVKLMNGRILKEARELADTETYTEVVGITIPETMRTGLQGAIMMYDRPQGGPAVDVDYALASSGGKATPEFIAAINKAADLFNQFAKLFKMDTKIRLQMDWTPLHPLYPHSFGLATRLLNGTYLVQVRADYFKGNILGLYSTMMHEFGHVVMWEHFDKLPDAMKLTLRGEYDKWVQQARANGTYGNLAGTRQSAIRFWMSRTGTSDSTWAKMISAMPRSFIEDYALTWEEWFADQVARWATATQEPVTMVEKTFQGIGKSIRFFLEWMAKKLGIDPRPTLLMQNWLNSVAWGLGPMGAQEYMNLDIRTQKANQYYVGIAGSDHDISMPPQQQATGSTRSTMNQVFGGNTPGSIKAMAAHADRMNWWYKYFAGLLELAAANPMFKPLVDFVEHNRLMHLEEVRVQDAAIRIVKQWRSLGKQMSDNLVDFMDRMMNMEYLTPQEKSRGVTRLPTQQEEANLRIATKLNADGYAVYTAVRNYFSTFLDLNQANAIQAAMKISDPVERTKRIDAINATVRKMKMKPYFPAMRFGRYYVTVKNPNGVTLYFDTFERKGLVSAERQQQRKFDELRALHPNDTVTKGILPESSEVFFGLPGPLLQHIKDKMNLTPGQLDALEQLQFEMSPALSFKHHFQHKRFVPGYSRDFMRAFARYAFHGARYYARTRHIDQLRDLIREARKIEDNKAHKIADYMADHLDKTILDAKGDFGIFKGAVFFWMMGLFPASATLNLSQTPMVTFPFLASKFGGLGLGETRASKALIRATTQWSNFYRRGTYDGKNLNQAWEMRAISYAIKTGRVTETQAPELAGIAQGGNLLFGAGSTGVQRVGNWILEKSATMFELAEQINRRIAYRATLELAMAHPNMPFVREAVSKYPIEYQDLIGKEGFTPSQARAILAASQVVESTQLVYARYARPRFMRGRMAGTVLVFHRFIQGMIQLGINNPSFAWRYLLIMMLMGGMGGLPGYEDLKSLIEGVAKRLGYNLNWEKEVRKFILEFTDDEKFPADLVLHGLARRGYGMPALTDFLGSYATGRPGRGFDATTSGKNVPYPQLDRSKAITFGPLSPIDFGKMIDPSADINQVLAEQGQRAAGAAFGMAFNAYKVLMDKENDWSDMKRWEKGLPRMVGALSKAYRAYSEGRERSGKPASGSTLVNYDKRDTEQMMEVIALALGYNNLRTSSKWDEIIAQQEHVAFIDFQRDALMDQLYEAVKGRNSEEHSQVIKRIQEFNNGIRGTEDRGKVITRESAEQSIKARERERVARERGIPTQKSNIPIAREFQRLFPETTIDVQRR